MKLVISVVTAFVFCGHRRSSEYDRADTHSIHVQDLYMYTYAQYYAMREAALRRPVQHGSVRATRCRRTRTVVFYFVGDQTDLLFRSPNQIVSEESLVIKF